MEAHFNSEDLIVVLPSEEVQKAIDDPAYAKKLAREAKKQQRVQENWAVHSLLPSPEPFVVIHEDGEDEELEEQRSKDGCARWSRDATLIFLGIYKDKEHLFKSGTRAHKFYWEEVAKDLLSHGYSFSWQQIASKMDSLKRRYKSIKDNIKESGNRSAWEFFPIMDEICNTPPPLPPLSSASSTGSESQPGSSSQSMDIGSSKKRKRPEDIEMYMEEFYARFKKDMDERLQKKLEEKAKRHRLSEEKKQQRHKEKQALRQQILDLLKTRLGLPDKCVNIL